MRGFYRIAVYVLVTAVVEGILIWGLFAYADAEHLTIWFILVENFGMVLFPPYQGVVLSGFLALIIGIVCWFLIITAIGETMNSLKKEKRDLKKTERKKETHPDEEETIERDKAYSTTELEEDF